MPVPDQVRDDGSGIQNLVKALDSGACSGPRSGVRRNDSPSRPQTFYKTINVGYHEVSYKGSEVLG
jgi:hypothetical protein